MKKKLLKIAIIIFIFFGGTFFVYANDKNILPEKKPFLTKEQVRQLVDVVDELRIPVLAYGLRTDFLGETFEGSHYLLAWADKLSELKTVCHCGRKASFVVRRDENSNAVTNGDQVQIGGNDTYESLCRKHFKELVWDR